MLDTIEFGQQLLSSTVVSTVSLLKSTAQRLEQAAFSMVLPGIALPDQSFAKFENLISIVTGGEAVCDEQMCYLPQSCAEYISSVEYFYFYVRFNSESKGEFPQYIRVPLVSLMVQNSTS